MLLLLLACKTDAPKTETTDNSGGLLGTGLYGPFPNDYLMQDGHMALVSAGLPQTDTLIPAERVAWRTGFSPVQPALVTLEGIHAEVLGTWRDIEPGGPVRLIDLDTGEEWPVFAELDAYPNAPAPALLIRPQAALPIGHEVAIVIDQALAPRPARFQTILDGENPSDFTTGAEDTRALVAQLNDLGIASDSIALAWSFPIGAGNAPVLDAIPQLTVPTDWDFYRVNSVADGDDLMDSAWRMADGHITVQDFLQDDLMFNIDADGHVLPTGSRSADIHVHIPTSVKDAPAGSVPILFYGHGIFGDAASDLNGYSSPIQLADELGFIVVSTTWGGLGSSDTPTAINVAHDMGSIPILTDHMAQSQLSYRSILLAITQGDLLNDPVFLGADGQALGNPEALYYYGISMGGIEGGVFTALNPEIKATGLHIPGSTWSVLLERTISWSVFEAFIVPAVPDPTDRQRLYALTQLWWDEVDPAAYADDLQDRPVLIQENLGDDTVTNIGTRILARSLNLPVISPVSDVPYGFSPSGALPAGSRAYTQLDPQLPEPPDGNRPAPETGAHVATEGWPATRAQLKAFFTPGEEGTIILPCGEDICTPSTAR